MFQVHYQRLHEIASSYFREEQGYRTLQPTAIVNEAYLRLGRDGEREWDSRLHFLAFAARVMRQVLVDAARRKGRRKRDAGSLRITLQEDMLIGEPVGPAVLDLERALEKLARRDPRKVEIVQLRFYGGMTLAEVAELLRVSLATINREWRLARAWLGRELGTAGT